MLEKKLGFIGAGQMATAMIKGLLRSDVCSPENLMASDIDDEQLKALNADTNVRTAMDNRAVAQWSDVLVLAVKPGVVSTVLKGIRTAINTEHLVVSIAAGVTIRALETELPPQTRVVRVIPNTPCLVGECAAGFAVGTHATEEDSKTVQTILSAIGLCFCVEEKLLDAVTGLSGSGPAYVYVLIEALADGGVRMGIPRSESLQLAAQTVLGAAKVVLRTGLHPGELKDRVASPGGTTIAGLHELERGGFRAAIMNAVCAATERSRDLAGE